MPISDSDLNPQKSLQVELYSQFGNVVLKKAILENIDLQKNIPNFNYSFVVFISQLTASKPISVFFFK